MNKSLSQLHKRRILERILYSVLLIIISSLQCDDSSADAAPEQQSKKQNTGYGTGQLYVPGHTDADRWKWLGNNLSVICQAKRSDLIDSLGSNPSTKKTGSLFYRITNSLSTDPFTDKFFELQIHCTGEDVVSVEIRCLERSTSPLATQKTTSRLGLCQQLE